MVLYDTRYNETIAADDGRELRANWFEPRDPRGAVLLVPAMATPASFYRAMAGWLADAGFLTLTFDYRGTGGPAELRAEKGDIVRWAGDAASALESLVQRADGLPVTWIGHSLGGQVLPFAHHGLVDRVVAVSSGNGYWRYNVPAVRRRAPLLWHTLAPTAIAATGYFPGRRLGIIGDVPPNVMRQWRRWCLSPRVLPGGRAPDPRADCARDNPDDQRVVHRRRVADGGGDRCHGCGLLLECWSSVMRGPVGSGGRWRYVDAARRRNMAASELLVLTGNDRGTSWNRRRA